MTLAVPSGQFDGLLACHFPKDDKFVTSINYDWIPPLDLKVHDTFVREDSSYGTNDFINTPQYLIINHVHRACIPTVSDDAEDPYFLYRTLWMPLHSDLLEPRSDDSTCGILEAMVQIAESYLRVIDIAADVMRI